MQVIAQIKDFLLELVERHYRTEKKLVKSIAT